MEVFAKQYSRQVRKDPVYEIKKEQGEYERSPVKMYGQRRYTYERSGEFDKLMLEGTICGLENDSPSQS